MLAAQFSFQSLVDKFQVLSPIDQKHFAFGTTEETLIAKTLGAIAEQPFLSRARSSLM